MGKNLFIYLWLFVALSFSCTISFFKYSLCKEESHLMCLWYAICTYVVVITIGTVLGMFFIFFIELITLLSNLFYAYSAFLSTLPFKFFVESFLVHSFLCF